MFPTSVGRAVARPKAIQAIPQTACRGGKPGGFPLDHPRVICPSISGVMIITDWSQPLGGSNPCPMSQWMDTSADDVGFAPSRNVLQSPGAHFCRVPQ